MATYTFTDIINPADPTFNQELGINDNGVIAGYNGSGAPGHPNQGYTTTTAGTTFTPENFPGSVQTQVTGINNQWSKRSVSIRPPTMGLTQTLDSGIIYPECLLRLNPKTPTASTRFPSINFSA